MNINLNVAFLGFITILLTACGGGGGGGSASAVPTPVVPGDPSAEPLFDLFNSSHMVDVDGDGDLDIIIGIQNEKLEIASDLCLINDGKANFTLKENAIPDHYLGKNGVTISISSADFNKDSFQDLITITVDGRDASAYETAQIHLYLGVGDGTFTDATNNISDSLHNEWPAFTRIGDFDLDGNLDFLLTKPGGEANEGRIYLNDGSANFAKANIVATDAERSYSSTQLYWESDGNTQAGRGSDRIALEVLIGDVNNDGNVDLVAPAGYAAGAMATYINKSTPGKLVFDLVYTVNAADPFDETSLKRFKDGALLDINNDGLLDMVGSNSISQQDEEEVPIYTYLNNGDGSFTQSTDISGSGLEHARQWLVADFNNDKLSDLFVADHGYDRHPFPGEKNLLLLNNGTGALVERTATSLSTKSSYTHGASVGDLNGDGYPDLLLNHSSKDVDGRLWINDGDGTFTSKDLSI